MKTKFLTILASLTLLATMVYATGRTTFRGQVRSAIADTLIPVGTTQTIDLDESNIQVLDLGLATGAVTLTINNPQIGAVYTFKIIQGAAARTLVWPSAMKWESGAEIILSTGNDDIDVVTCLYDGTSYFCNYGNDYL